MADNSAFGTMEGQVQARPAVEPPRPADQLTWRGKPLKRHEDPRLLAGHGCFVGDVSLPGMLWLQVVRSPHAHARIRRIEMAAALAEPGLVAVFTARDLAGKVAPLPLVWQTPGLKIARYMPLAEDTVKHVGDPVAVVVGQSRYGAEDAAKLVQVDYEPLPVAADCEAAAALGAPVIHPELGTNVAYDWSMRFGEVERAFAEADAVFEEDFRIQRLAGAPMETRGVVADFDPLNRRLTVWNTTQAAHLMKDFLTDALSELEGVDVRVIAPDVGGGFGNYYSLYPEEVLAVFASLRLGRPVKWIEDRAEAFLATVHAREQRHRVSIALKRDGAILGLRDRIVADIGAYLDISGVGPAILSAVFLPGPYHVPAYGFDLTCVYTNKTRSGSYRGFGQPQAVFARERILDIAARGLGLDPAELRRRNLVRPEEMPYNVISGPVFDSGQYAAALDKALDLAGYEDVRRQQAVYSLPLREGRGSGRGSAVPLPPGRMRLGQGTPESYLGVGFAVYTEHTAGGSTADYKSQRYQAGSYETAWARLDASGTVTVLTGHCPTGQGLETTLAQVAAEELGLDPTQVHVAHGDTATVPHGTCGTIASRGAITSNATMGAARKLRERILALAAALLEAGAADLDIENGHVFVRGSRERRLSFREIGRQAQLGHNVPQGQDYGLEASYSFDPPTAAFSNGVHVAVVEVDSQTASVKLLRYVIVHDCGPMINPLLVEGQIHGGAGQGIGAALLEELVFDEGGQLRNGNFMDYAMPTALDVPEFIVAHLETPSPFIPTGVKGMGEGGTIPAPAAVANAVEDALAHLGVRIRETPLTPDRLWRAVQPSTSYIQRAGGVPSP